MGTAGEPGDYRDLALSPDGTRLAVTKRSGQDSDIWLLDLSRGDEHTVYVWFGDGDRQIRSGRRMGAALSLAPTEGLQPVSKAGEQRER